MALIVDALIKVFKKPTVGGVVLELALFVAPLWAAAVVGLLIGWAWRPRWAAGLVGGGRRMPSPQPSESFLSGPINNLVSFYRSSAEQGKMVDDDLVVPGSESLAVAEDDLEHLCQLVEMRDGGPEWHLMMDKLLPTFSYQAWRRDPQSGPSQYRSRTVFEDATPEMVRDFFWDDEFRIKNKWDDMLLQHVTLEECPATGTMVVHWIRKFPFFCSDRDYTIGRRIWESGRTYYCVTKGVPCPSVPRRNKPRRVDLYYSSWCIRAVESRRGDGQLTACEVILFHHEDMGIPQEIAKLGIRQGMWSCVKKIEPGLRAYQMARMSGEPLSRCALMAQINTKVSPDYLMSFQINGSSSDIIEAEKEKHCGFNIPRFLVIGGAVALACTLDRGLVTKAVIFGVARRFANFGKRL